MVFFQNDQTVDAGRPEETHLHAPQVPQVPQVLLPLCAMKQKSSWLKPKTSDLHMSCFITVRKKSEEYLRPYNSEEIG